mgnify:CR=1 FL=1
MNPAVEPIPLARLALVFVPVLVVLLIQFRWTLPVRSTTYGLGRMLLQLLLVGYVLVYAVVFYAGIYYLTRVVRNGMLPNEERETAGDNFRRPMRPLSATETPFDDDVDPVRN